MKIMKNLVKIVLLLIPLYCSAQTNVSLTWDASPSTNVIGYNLYYHSNTFNNSVADYTSKTVLGTNLNYTYTNLVNKKYYFIVTARSSDLESDVSNELIVDLTPILPPTPPPAPYNLRISIISIPIIVNPPVTNIFLEANSGQFFSPFVLDNNIAFQNVGTSFPDAGKAIYAFNIETAGNYILSFDIDAPTEGNNSFFININNEPTDPYMVWHVPVTTNFENRTVSWQGNGNWDNSEFVPKIFNLGPGSHQIIIKGREANTRFRSINIIKQ